MSGSYLSISTAVLRGVPLILMIATQTLSAQMRLLARRHITGKVVVAILTNNRTEFALVLVDQTDRSRLPMTLSVEEVINAVEGTPTRRHIHHKNWEPFVAHITARGDDLTLEVLSPFQAEEPVIQFLTAARAVLVHALSANGPHDCVAPAGAVTFPLEIRA